MEAGVAPKRVAWVVVGVLACGFSYSIGWQSGSTDATLRAADRFNIMTETYEQLRAMPDDAGQPSAEYGASAAARHDESF